jgi:hypothetical protein
LSYCDKFSKVIALICLLCKATYGADFLEFLTSSSFRPAYQVHPRLHRGAGTGPPPRTPCIFSVGAGAGRCLRPRTTCIGSLALVRTEARAHPQRGRVRALALALAMSTAGSTSFAFGCFRGSPGPTARLPLGRSISDAVGRGGRGPFPSRLLQRLLLRPLSVLLLVASKKSQGGCVSFLTFFSHECQSSVSIPRSFCSWHRRLHPKAPGCCCSWHRRLHPKAPITRRFQ